ncbi:hypothetical protein FH972_023997 [Carpinus fangiana]|uniref:Uncharacterized protein n=1 Tax=Carpinus fangiana TaxID=176857 RepID=A0A5N6KWR6_9ROSI|nr:hypothetical protein FH972_023997 [Carpinus fangiana]
MLNRKDEILAKKAKLAELKRQRELRQKEFSVNRQSIGSPSDITSSPRNRSENRQELDNLISSLVGEDRGGSPAPGSPSLSTRGRSRPTSYASPAKTETEDDISSIDHHVAPTGQAQVLSFAPITTTYEITSDPPKREVLTYSKGVQTNEPWMEQDPPSPDEVRPVSRDRPASSGVGSARHRKREEELRQNIRREIETELRAVQEGGGASSTLPSDPKANYPARTLTNEELEAVTSSHDFLEFVERSSKVIERALDEEYDVLADYQQGNLAGVDDDDENDITGKGRKGRRIREHLQFFDDRWSKKRVISDVGFSPKHPELVLASYTKNPSAPYDASGLVMVWNQHMPSRPEFVFQNTSDILTARFSPFHPNLIIGGSYSGQVLLWDTRAKSPHPVQKTPLTGNGHTHPIYSLNVVGTQNAHNIISTSTDGVLCSWSVDMLSQPQEKLELTAPPPPVISSSTNANGVSLPAPASSSRQNEDIAPTTTTFPPSDPTYLLLGTESGLIHLCHRYDRAGARAGIDANISYSGHQAPVMSLDFHKASGPLDLGDLALSAGADWSVKVWRVRTPAAASIAKAADGSSKGPAGVQGVAPVIDIPRDDVVYDAKWSPVKPGVFACVDGTGSLEVWDLCIDTEVPVARGQPSPRVIDGIKMPARSLNKCAWEQHTGQKIAVGGLDGVLSVFEVGGELGGADSARADEWGVVKRLVQRAEGKINGVK